MATDEQLKKLAKERVDFKNHLVAYIGVNVFLFLLNMLTSPDALWFYWPLVIWGIFVVMHWIEVYVRGGKSGEEVRVEEEYKKLKAKQK